MRQEHASSPSQFVSLEHVDAIGPNTCKPTLLAVSSVAVALRLQCHANTDTIIAVEVCPKSRTFLQGSSKEGHHFERQPCQKQLPPTLAWNAVQLFLQPFLDSREMAGIPRTHEMHPGPGVFACEARANLRATPAFLRVPPGEKLPRSAARVRWEPGRRRSRPCNAPNGRPQNRDRH